MADISNKTLSVFLVATIIVSLAGTMLIISKTGGIDDFTGRVTYNQTSGITNFSINSSLSIIFNNNVVAFGQGYVNDTIGNCTMGTNNTPPGPWAQGCIGFNTNVHNANLTIENNGNIKANVSLNFSRNATTFIGGTSPIFLYRVRSVEPGSCSGSIGNGSSFQAVGAPETTASGARVCNTLEYIDANDLIDVGFFLSIPKDALPGTHTVAISAIACDDNSC